MPPPPSLSPSPSLTCSFLSRFTNQATASGLVTSSAAAGTGCHQRKNPGFRPLVAVVVALEEMK